MISVLTCAKRGQYLAQTIASIDRSGGAEYSGPKFIHVDGPADEIPAGPWRDGWEVVSLSPARAGTRLAMLAIMKRAAAAGVETLLYFEDDVVLCKNAIRAMVEIGVPAPLGFVTYCDLMLSGPAPLELVAFPGCPRNAPVADGGFRGCQALAVGRAVIERLATDPVPHWITRHDVDAVMGTSCEIYGVVDSLANHVGAESLIRDLTYQRLPNPLGWRGEHFDADVVPRAFVMNDPGERCHFHCGVLHDTRRPCAASLPAHAIEAPPTTDL